MGLLLGEYVDKCEIALAWRGGMKVHGLTQEQLDADLDKLLREQLVFPADIAQQLLVRRIRELVSEQKW